MSHTDLLLQPLIQCFIQTFTDLTQAPIRKLSALSWPTLGTAPTPAPNPQLVPTGLKHKHSGQDQHRLVKAWGPPLTKSKRVFQISVFCLKAQQLWVSSHKVAPNHLWQDRVPVAHLCVYLENIPPFLLHSRPFSVLFGVRFTSKLCIPQLLSPTRASVEPRQRALYNGHFCICFKSSDRLSHLLNDK